MLFKAETLPTFKATFDILDIQGLTCRERYTDVFSMRCRDLPVDPRTLLGSVDIRETDKDYQFVVDVPGLTKDDVKVRVSGDNILTIEGERKVRPRFCMLVLLAVTVLM